MKILDYKFKGTTGIMASLQLNLKVGKIADPLTSKMYDERALEKYFESYVFRHKKILNFYVNSP